MTGAGEGGWARLALYYTLPPGSPLERLGTAWLGRDLATGLENPPTKLGGLPRAAEEITRGPRRYGLHATLKNPFRLAPGTSLAALAQSVAAFAAARATLPPVRLRVSALGPFLALVPEGPAPELDAFAAEVVRTFEPFRAPLTEADRARRQAAGLSVRQQELLERWGYPFVMEEFRFHITLSGRLAPEDMPATRAALEAHLSPALAEAVPINALSLCGEDGEGRFHMLTRFPLTG
ncbi:MAG: DUF1045 domain-containing protein [Rhodobacteraceae bacterium]|nr:DUF1045 domain-containing protein [Paracoccaceae bacterium]